ncbi:hypothetical protein PTH_2654 [Pelotomaculum thermopropionicum SI]|uniref:Radical SAM core domain-containing protein n=1 Tax=Pelotomaculum thermopropionicum (strain DSM 13744 / JCM 10971 / SI) TaxID=370438 RepID=A5CYV3_PELTS|nr:hypothetical protein PTH_2654 [Pelotomaculum thermopropionicum SI]
MGEFNGGNNGISEESIILSTAARDNILPLTSSCNVRCLFCSHRQNPPGVKVYRMAPRSLAEVGQTIAFLDPERPVIIGESATRIIEGEPFTHPAVDEVLRLVRAALPRTAVQITTNGSLLDERRAWLLGDLGNAAVCLSLNSASELGRALLMGDANPGAAIKSPVLLKKYGVPFHGSVVAMPHLVGWDDLKKTVSYLCECGAQTVRVFLPGYTALAPPALRFGQPLWEQLGEFVLRLREETEIPVTCEPPLIAGLEPEVAGVIAASPAAGAGIRRGDVIEAVNGVPAMTRVHAFKMVLEAGSPEITANRGGERLIFKLWKEPGQRSGLVMEYDLDPRLIEEMGRAARQHGAAKVLVFTSELAVSAIKAGLQRFWKENAEVEAVAVKNSFFGGSIKAAGLLTLFDFEAGMEKYLAAKPGERPCLVLLPGLAFDERGRDLTGRSFLELNEKFDTAFETLC